MIDYIKSAKLNNCTVGELKIRFKKFPKSNKKIIVQCEVCGDSREVYHHLYDNNLCCSCAAKKRTQTSEGRKAQSILSHKQFEDPYQRELVSKRHKGKITSTETRNKQSNAHKGKITSDDTKTKQSISRRNSIAGKRRMLL